MNATFMPAIDQTRTATAVPSELHDDPIHDLACQLAALKSFGFSGSLTAPTLHLVLDNCCSNWNCAQKVHIVVRNGQPEGDFQEAYHKDELMKCGQVHDLETALEAAGIEDVVIFGFDSDMLAFDLDSGGCIQAGFGNSKVAVVTRQRSSDEWTPVGNSYTKEASQIITKVLRNFAVG